MCGSDSTPSATSPSPQPRLLDTASAPPPVKPLFAFVRLPGWDDAEGDTRDAFAELVESLGDQAFELDLPQAFENAERERRRINFAEMARHYYRYGRDGADQLGPETLDALAEGNGIPARDYLAALDWRPVLNAGLAEIFDRCDAILCPAAPGPAPEGLASTGNSIFNGLWTFCGTPAVTVPLLTAGNGLPMGVQLVGPIGHDARLLRTAHWLWTRAEG